MPYQTKQGLDPFGDALTYTLANSNENSQTAESAPSSTSSLSETALAATFREFENLMQSPFSCGGTIDIAGLKRSSSSTNKRCKGPPSFKRTSPPVHVYWTTETGSATQKLVLPSENTDVLQKLVKDCEPATFGRGQQDVLDTEYRKAGKLDTDHFATTFHPADFGIVENIEQLLLPSVSTEEQNSLGFRKLRVELYKLNVYSGPSGLFRKHVDTPRSTNQIGSLVVCLPSKFKGGKFAVQHDGQSVEFDWAPQSDAAIQWAAFYSDCEHEIETVSEGERITLTYNLYVTEPVEALNLPRSAVQPKSLPIYSFLKSLVSEPGFMKHGGVLGVYCSHAYPHSADIASALLPLGLKGADLMLYSVLNSLGLQVKVLPVLGPTLFDDYGRRSSRNSNEKQKVGKELWPAAEIDMEIEEEEDFLAVLRDYWDYYRVQGITWLSEQRHSQHALTYLTYGNEASIGTAYSYAAILAIIPPYDERKGVTD